MDVTALIIEDEKPAAELLEKMLAASAIPVRVLDNCGDLPSGVMSIKKNKPDVVFLDIELPIYNGTQLLEFFKPEEIDFSIIFTTAYNEYALKAFEMSAVDYLLKPLQMDKLKAALQKAAARQGIRPADSLAVLKENLRNHYGKMIVSFERDHEIVDLANIVYIDAEKAYSNIVLQEGKPLLSSKNIGQYESLLQHVPYFFRVHRSHIVNLNYVKKLSSDAGAWFLQLKSGKELRVSEDKKDEVFEKIRNI